MLILKGNRLLKIFIICLVTFISGCARTEQVNYDFATYLSGDSDFEKNIATVMPTKEELKNSKILYYVHYDDGDYYESFQDRMLCLTVKYNDEEFKKTVSEMEAQSELYYNKVNSKQFYYNGVLYNGFVFHNNDDYGFAYNACSDSNTVSYLAFDCMPLQTMNVQDALSCFPRFEVENQIVSYE